MLDEDTDEDVSSSDHPMYPPPYVYVVDLTISTTSMDMTWRKRRKSSEKMEA